MNWFQKIWYNIVSSDNQPFIDEINSLKAQVDTKKNELNECNLKYNTKNEEYDLLADELSILQDKYDSLKDKDLSDEDILKGYWDSKYVKGILTYGGRSLPFSTTTINVPVNVLITPQDGYIVADLKRWGLYQTGEDPETLIPKIYAKIKSEYYKYKFDQTVWGKNEVWEFPFEMREKAIHSEWGFDCDSWASFMVSYYIAAGVPNWRVRVVVGDAYLGGHSTVYCFSMEDFDWHHLNSTYGRALKSNLSDYPTHKDAKNPKDNLGTDLIGIYKVWLSYNNEFCWYKFESDIPKELQVNQNIKSL